MPRSSRVYVPGRQPWRRRRYVVSENYELSQYLISDGEGGFYSPYVDPPDPPEEPDEFSLEFNDTTVGTGSYMSLSSAAIRPTFDNATQCAVSMWVKDDTGTATDTGMLFSSWGITTAYGNFRLQQLAGSWRVILPNTSGQYFATRQWSFTRTPGQWYHLVANYNAGALDLYIDGVAGAFTDPISSPPAILTTFLPNNNESTYLFGGRWTGTVVDNTFNDTQIYQPVIYNRSLTAPEIAEIYNAGTPILPEDLASFSSAAHRWKFDDATGLVVPDSVGGAEGLVQDGVAADIKQESP